MTHRQIIGWFVLVNLLAVGGLFAQTAPPLGVSVSSCAVTVSQSWAPTPQSGWGVQFTYQPTGGAVVNFGARDTSSPYGRSRTFQAGAYTLGGTWTRTGSPAVAITSVPYTCGATPPPPAPVHCAGTWSAWTGGAWSACTGGTQTRAESRTFTATTPASGGGLACPPSPETRMGSQSCTVTPPPTGLPIWGDVVASVLGECSAAAHDAFTVDGGDGYRYRTWHPQQDPSGCFYAHEHGDNPASQTHAWTKANWDGRMGYAARRMPTPTEPNGHMEGHEGYKVHVVNIGDVNNENRVNQTATTSMPHMGSAGPGRFNIQHHSVSITDWHQNGVHHTSLHGMFDTGGNSTVCQANRADAPTKDVLMINGQGQHVCKVDSGYEIWGMAFKVMRGASELLRKFVTPAMFDPATVFNFANPTELVYAWDPRVAAIKNHPDDWSGNRGCDREGYAQVGYHYTGNEPSETYWLTTMGVVTTQSDPTAIRAIIGKSDTGGNPPFSSNILQFKLRKSHCGNRAKLGLRN